MSKLVKRGTSLIFDFPISLPLADGSSPSTTSRLPTNFLPLPCRTPLISATSTVSLGRQNLTSPFFKHTSYISFFLDLRAGFPCHRSPVNRYSVSKFHFNFDQRQATTSISAIVPSAGLSWTSKHYLFFTASKSTFLTSTVLASFHRS